MEGFYFWISWWFVINYNLNFFERKFLNIEFLFFLNLEFKNKIFLKCEVKNYFGRFICWWLIVISIDLKFSVKSSRG